MSSIDVNNTELSYAEPRLLVIDAEPRISFWEKTSPNRVETLTKHNQAELMIY